MMETAETYEYKPYKFVVTATTVPRTFFADQDVREWAADLVEAGCERFVVSAVAQKFAGGKVVDELGSSPVTLSAPELAEWLTSIPDALAERAVICECGAHNEQSHTDYCPNASPAATPAAAKPARKPYTRKATTRKTAANRRRKKK